jgi:hypothetical protein
MKQINQFDTRMDRAKNVTIVFSRTNANSASRVLVENPFKMVLICIDSSFVSAKDLKYFHF